MKAIVSKAIPVHIRLTKLCAFAILFAQRPLVLVRLVCIMVIDLGKIRSGYCLIERDDALSGQDRRMMDDLRLKAGDLSLY